MRFTVVADASGLPNATVAAGTVLRQTSNAIVNIKNVVPAIKRQLTLNEVIGPGGPLELVLNNTKYNGVDHRVHDPRLPSSPRSATRNSGRSSTSPPTRIRCTPTWRVSSS